MKMKIIFGCLICFFILITTPAIPALKVESIKKTVESIVIENKNNLNIQLLKEKIKEKLPLSNEYIELLAPLVALILILFSIQIMEEDPILSFICLMCAFNILMFSIM